MEGAKVRMMLGLLRSLEGGAAGDDAAAENVRCAEKCLSALCGLDLASDEVKTRYAYEAGSADGSDAAQIFRAGELAIGAKVKETGRAAEPKVSELSPESEKYEQEFGKFVTTLKRTPFFTGVTEGSNAYAERVAKARAKFEAKYGPPPVSTPAATRSAAPVGMSSDAQPAPSTSEDSNTVTAERYKQQGNDALKAERFAEALSLYNKAIEADGSNAVYYSNRAAAKIHLQKYSSAIDDCKTAISLNPSYGRARERLASAYRSCGMVEEEIEALQDALALDLNNSKLESDLDSALRRQAGVNAEDTTGPQSQASRPSGMPDLGALLNNPMMAQMASQMMSNPNIQQMMSDPNVMQQAMSMFGGTGGAHSGTPGGSATATRASSASRAPERGDDATMNSTSAEGGTGTETNPPGLEGLLGSLPPGLRESLRNNPQMAAMAERVRSDPSQIGDILNNPDAMSQIMSMASSMFGGDAGSGARNNIDDEEDDSFSRAYYS